jgi:chromosome segregation ATPase
MKLGPQIYISAAVALVIAAAIFVATLLSNHKIASLERDIESAKAAAEEIQSIADELEKRSYEYKAKTEYLEQQLAEIQAIARKQDEELETLTNSVSGARRDVDRARSIRSIDATADELCRKLAELGHGCQ